jgi:hypothetical protein
VALPRHFAMTEDLTDLACLAMIPLAVAYGARRLRVRAPRSPAA